MVDQLDKLAAKAQLRTIFLLWPSGPSIVPLSDNLPHTKTVAPKSAGKVGVTHTESVHARSPRIHVRYDV